MNIFGELKIKSKDTKTSISLNINDRIYEADHYKIASVNLTGSTFNCTLNKIVFENSELEGFANDLKTLEKERQGEVTLSAEDPRQFKLRIKSIDRVGHFEISLQLGEGIDYKNQLNISFEIDPSQLPHILTYFSGSEDVAISGKNKALKYKQDSEFINKLLEEWNFLKIPNERLSFEYNDLSNFLLNLLKRDRDEKFIAKELNKEISKNYGVRIETKDADVILFSKKIRNWWNK